MKAHSLAETSPGAPLSSEERDDGVESILVENDFPFWRRDATIWLEWLQKCGDRWRGAFQPHRMETADRRFAKPGTLIKHGDEAAIVPRHP